MQVRTGWVIGSLLVSAAAQAAPPQDAISALKEAERKPKLEAVLKSLRVPCPAITRTFYQGEDKKGTAYWNVACTGGASYVVLLEKKSTSVQTCKPGKPGQTDCFKKMPEGA